MKAGFPLSTQKNAARTENMTHELHQENSVESGEPILSLSDSEEATQSKTLAKNTNQNFQDLLDVFTELQYSLETPVFEPIFQTLREDSKPLEHFF